MSSKRPPLPKPMPLGDLIHQLLHQHRPSSAHQLAQIWEVWPQAVGDAIARHAKPSAIHGQQLVVHVTNSTWLHQLRFMKADMLTQLNQLLDSGRVVEIKFKIGAL